MTPPKRPPKPDWRSWKKSKRFFSPTPSSQNNKKPGSPAGLFVVASQSSANERQDSEKALRRIDIALTFAHHRAGTNGHLPGMVPRLVITLSAKV
jgi:hypothetical protein